MATNCPEFHILESTLLRGRITDEERRLSFLHIRDCASCRLQWEAHSQMRALGRTLRTPALPTDFNFRMRARLRRDVDPKAISNGKYLLLRAYWLLACAASLYLIARVDWPSSLKSFWVPPFLVLLVLAFTVVEFLSVHQVRRIAVWLRLSSGTSLPFRQLDEKHRTF